jgi:hypothetical protein
LGQKDQNSSKLKLKDHVKILLHLDDDEKNLKGQKNVPSFS